MCKKLLAHLPTMLPVQNFALCLLLSSNIREKKQQSLLFNSVFPERIYNTFLYIFLVIKDRIGPFCMLMS
jgi:hypothetical protein